LRSWTLTRNENFGSKVSAKVIESFTVTDFRG
jgi:hypothetical protein